MAVNPDRFPYSYYEDGQMKGILPELFADIAERVGIRYQILISRTREEYKTLLDEKGRICALTVMIAFHGQRIWATS